MTEVRAHLELQLCPMPGCLRQAVLRRGKVAQHLIKQLHGKLGRG
jgi:hypothetical protein